MISKGSDMIKGNVIFLTDRKNMFLSKFEKWIFLLFLQLSTFQWFKNSKLSDLYGSSCGICFFNIAWSFMPEASKIRIYMDDLGQSFISGKVFRGSFLIQDINSWKLDFFIFAFVCRFCIMFVHSIDVIIPLLLPIVIIFGAHNN